MRVLFSFFERANLPAALPVAQALMGHPWLRPVVVQGYDHKEAQGLIPPLMRAPGLPWIDINEWVGSAGDEAVSHLATRELGALQSSFTARVDAAALPLRQHLADTLWLDLLKERHKVAAALHRLIRYYRPSLVVIPEDVHWIQGGLAAEVAQAANVPSLVLLAPYYQLIASTPVALAPKAQAYTAMNPAVAAELAAAGVPPGIILASGSPYFLPALNTRGRALAAAKSYLALFQGKAGEGELLADLCTIFTRHPELNLCVRPHPDAAPSLANMVWPANVRLDPGGQLGDQLVQADAVIGISSSGLAAAALAGLPLIVVHYAATPPELRLPATWQSLLVQDHVELAAAVCASAKGHWPRYAASEWLGNVADSVRLSIAAIERLALAGPYAAGAGLNRASTEWH